MRGHQTMAAERCPRRLLSEAVHLRAGESRLDRFQRDGLEAVVPRRAGELAANRIRHEEAVLVSGEQPRRGALDLRRDVQSSAVEEGTEGADAAAMKRDVDRAARTLAAVERRPALAEA